MLSTTPEAIARREKLIGLSDEQRRDYRHAVEQAAADDIQRGTAMLSTTGEYLAAEYDEIQDEDFTIREGFDAVTAAAARPDADRRLVTKTYTELVARARADEQRMAGWAKRVEEHKEQAKDPAGVYVALTRRWADKSLVNAGQFLRNFPF